MCVCVRITETEGGIEKTGGDCEYRTRRKEIVYVCLFLCAQYQKQAREGWSRMGVCVTSVDAILEPEGERQKHVCVQLWMSNQERNTHTSTDVCVRV